MVKILWASEEAKEQCVRIQPTFEFLIVWPLAYLPLLHWSFLASMWKDREAYGWHVCRSWVEKQVSGSFLKT
jgi:hypothetical protein